MPPIFLHLIDDGVVNSTDPQWQSTYRNVYTHPALSIPWYAILGNHDYHKNPQAQIDYYLEHQDDRWNMPDHFYTKTFPLPNCPQTDGNCHLEIIFVDTSILAPSETQQTHLDGIHPVTAQQQMTALTTVENMLKASTARWLIVAGHYTIHSMAEHGDIAELRDLLVPLLERYQVNLYLNGHDHVLQHISWHGVEYVTSGHGTMTQNYPYGYWNYSRGSAAGKGSRFGTIGPGYGSASVSLDLLTFALSDRYGQDLYSFTLTNPRLGLTSQQGDRPGSITESTSNFHHLRLKPSVAFVLTLLGLLSGIFMTIVFLRCSTTWRLRILGEPVIRVRKASRQAAEKSKKQQRSTVVNPFTISGEDDEEDHLEKGFDDDSIHNEDHSEQHTSSTSSSRSNIFGTAARNGYSPMKNDAIPGEDAIEMSTV